MNHMTLPTLGGLAFQVGFDPLLYFLAAVVGGVEADSERLGLAPGHDTAEGDAGQSQQRKRDLYIGSRRHIFGALQGHAAGADFEAGSGDALVIRADYGDLCHDRDAGVAPEFVEHEHVGGANQFEGRGPLQRFLEHGVDTELGVAHGLLRVAAETVEHDAAVGGGSACGVHDRLGACAQTDDAGFEFLLAQTLGRAGRHEYSLNAKLPETLGQQGSGRFFQVDQGGAGRGLLGRGSEGWGSAKGLYVGGRFSSTKVYCGAPGRRWKDPKGQGGSTKVSLP